MSIPIFQFLPLLPPPWYPYICSLHKRCESWGDKNIILVMMDAISANILQVTELYSLNGWIVWQVNFISIKTNLKKPIIRRVIGLFFRAGLVTKLCSDIRMKSLWITFFFSLPKTDHFGESKESWAPKNWCSWTGVGEDSWESLGLQGDPTSQS